MYSISSVTFTNPVGTSVPFVARVTCSEKPNNFPMYLYIKNNNIHNYSTTTKTWQAGTSNLLYLISKLNISTREKSTGKLLTFDGLHLFYNPLDNSNNIGYSIDSSGTATAVDFATLQKYAPWPIVAPSV